VTSVETSTVALSSYVSTNEALWASATPASTLDHGGLQGLGDDDHPQYLLADSSRAASGNLTINNYDESPPSDPVALVIKTIDSVPTNETAIGEIRFAGNNGAPANKVYNRIRGISNDVAAGSEDGSIQLRHLLAGSEVISLIASGGGVTVEESLTVSTCPIPPPWSFATVTVADGVNTSLDYYFASGASQSKTEIDAAHITWDSTNSYFTIANAGFYEFEMQGSVIVNTSPTTITTSILETTGLGGTESVKITKNQLIRANIDPHDVMIKWVGEVAAGKNYTCKFNSGGGGAANQLQRGSTFTCKRIN